MMEHTLNRSCDARFSGTLYIKTQLVKEKLVTTTLSQEHLLGYEAVDNRLKLCKSPKYSKISVIKVGDHKILDCVTSGNSLYKGHGVILIYNVVSSKYLGVSLL
jgi:hypothetical protein